MGQASACWALSCTYITRNGDDCGITTDPMLAVVEVEVEGREEQSTTAGAAGGCCHVALKGKSTALIEGEGEEGEQEPGSIEPRVQVAAAQVGWHWYGRLGGCIGFLADLAVVLELR